MSLRVLKSVSSGRAFVRLRRAPPKDGFFRFFNALLSPSPETPPSGGPPILEAAPRRTVSVADCLQDARARPCRGSSRSGLGQVGSLCLPSAPRRPLTRLPGHPTPQADRYDSFAVANPGERDAIY